MKMSQKPLLCGVVIDGRELDLVTNEVFHKVDMMLSSDSLMPPTDEDDEGIESDEGQSSFESPAGLTSEASYLIPEPRNIAQTGLGMQVLSELVLKIIYHGGRLTGHQISTTIRLPFTIVQEVLTYLKAEGFIEVVGARASANSPTSIGEPGATKRLKLGHPQSIAGLLVPVTSTSCSAKAAPSGPSLTTDPQ
jgi:hypothetical protein